MVINVLTPKYYYRIQISLYKSLKNDHKVLVTSDASDKNVVSGTKDCKWIEM